MEENDEFEGDHLTRTTSFSQLLFGDDGENAVGHDVDQTLRYSSIFSIDKTPKMLCFGNYQNEGDSLFSEITATPQKSVLTTPVSSSPSFHNHSSFSSVSKSNKKRNGSGQECTDSISTATTVASKKPPKRSKAENPTTTGHAKRKEKLGERIAALQQLVSPFGKTDTASVLHEAMGYIRFLHDQVQVLCSPYLQCLPSPHHHHNQPGDDRGDEKGEEAKDLRSKGLCLIPVECTEHVANGNGADFWSPAMGDNQNNNA
ncbi:hypothetical protein L6164_035730 [Bauhinia variegata]|uniref:Uncharacterized protein n=1 Tax=Bauhinia variegata TaxID=167791 RepID=A0ACB9KEX9_BAUVA|nr:hypothetical protein L6164_035730 [Bauhinia variegata]